MAVAVAVLVVLVVLLPACFLARLEAAPARILLSAVDHHASGSPCRLTRRAACFDVAPASRTRPSRFDRAHAPRPQPIATWERRTTAAPGR